MTTALKRTGAALLTLLMFCVLTLGASAAANTSVGVKFWKEKSDKESMANSGIDSDREATLTRQSNGTYTLTLPVKQVTKLNVTGHRRPAHRLCCGPPELRHSDQYLHFHHLGHHRLRRPGYSERRHLGFRF